MSRHVEPDDEERHAPYPVSVRDAAYAHWRAHGSMRGTAAALGIPDGTVRAWSRADGWTLRRLADDDRDRVTVHAMARLRLTAEIDALVEETLAIALHARDGEGMPDYRVRLAAQRLLYELDGFGAAPPSAPSLAPTSAPRRALSADERRTVIVRLLETGKEMP